MKELEVANHDSLGEHNRNSKPFFARERSTRSRTTSPVSHSALVLPNLLDIRYEPLCGKAKS